MTAGLPPRWSDTHCGVIAITKSYHLPHHSGTISANVVPLWNHIKCKNGMGYLKKHNSFFSEEKGRHVSMSISFLWKNYHTTCKSPIAEFNYQPLYQIRKRPCSKGCSFQLLSHQIPKEISFTWTMHFFLFKKKERKSISGFNMRGWESISPGFRFFSPLSWAVNRNNGIWLLQGQGCLSW